MKRHLMDATSELRIEPIRHRIRAFVGEDAVVDTTRAVLVWEPRRIVPVFAIPADDIDAELVPADPGPGQDLSGQDLSGLPPLLGPMQFEIHTSGGEPMTLSHRDEVLADAAFRPSDPDLDGMVTLNFDAFTRWMEEEQELVGHAHDPFKRIDVLRTSRHVTVSLDGQVLADSKRPSSLLETHLPTRWYLPRDDVRMDLLEPSENRSTCAYKGIASYFSAPAAGQGRDIAWTYPGPKHDAIPVGDHICFWSERTDLTVDEEPVRRPVTPWSSPDEQRSADLEHSEFG